MTEPYAPEAPETAKEIRKIRHKFGNGPSWDVPVDVIKALLDSAWHENPEFMGRHLQGALTGELPRTRRARRNGDGGAGE